ncbi:MAG: hypothetical protein H7836_10930 [Magnetococcus sp. YQC-3]
MTTLGTYLEGLANRIGVGMDCRGLLVALYAGYAQFKSEFQEALRDPPALDRETGRLRAMFGINTESSSLSLPPIPLDYRRELGHRSGDKHLLLLASLQLLSSVVRDYIRNNGLLGDRVLHPNEEKYYLLLLREDSPWASGDYRYSQGKFWPSGLHIVPEQDGFQIKYMQLPERLTQRMVGAVQRVVPAAGEEAVPIVRIAVWPVDKSLVFRVQQAASVSAAPNRGRYVPFSLLDDEGRGWEEQVEQFQQFILPECQKEKVLVLLLPELTVPPRFLEKLQDVMKARAAAIKAEARREGTLGDPPCYPVLLVAGSFHLPEGGEPQQTVNRTVVLDYCGQEITLQESLPGLAAEQTWFSDKLSCYTICKSQIAQAPELIEALGLNGKGVVYATEPGDPGKYLPVVQAGPLGRMAAVICRDLFDELSRWFGRFQGKGWVDWLYVPSASTETARFTQANKEWSQKGVCTVVVNACWLLEQAKKWPDSLFAQAGIPQGEPVFRASDPPPGRKRYALWRRGDCTGRFGLQPTLSGQSTSCSLSCGECLAVLDVELDGEWPLT